MQEYRPMNPESIQQQLAKVRISYIESLTEKKSKLQQLWGTLKTQWLDKVYQELYIIIHGLAGSAGTFDLPDISDRAREIINIFKDSKIDQSAPNDALLDNIQGKLDDLFTSLNQAT